PLAGPGGPALEPTNRGMPQVPVGYPRRRHGAPESGMFADIADGAKDLAGRVRHWPRVALLGVGAGVVVAMVVVIGFAAGWCGGGKPAAAGHPAASPAPTNTPLIKARQYHDAQRGFTLNVPADWQQHKGTSYVDFVDPQDPAGRKLRVNVEPAGNTAKK